MVRVQRLNWTPRCPFESMLDPNSDPDPKTMTKPDQDPNLEKTFRIHNIAVKVGNICKYFFRSKFDMTNILNYG
jgi:hypothetical protein